MGDKQMVWMCSQTMGTGVIDWIQNIPEAALTILPGGLVIDCERRIRGSKTYHFF